MNSTSTYRLVGDDGLAHPKRFPEANWFAPSVERQRMLELMKRTNRRAATDMALWLSLLSISGALLVVSWSTLWSIPAAAAYGVLYGSAADARWHECGHRTAFATKQLNDVFYHLASFMVLREPVSWRKSHVRHHTETIFVGRDPEIAFPRPMPRWRMAAEMFGLLSFASELRKYASSAVGRVPADVRSYVPERELGRVAAWSRIHLSVLLATAGACVHFGSMLPAMLVGLPTLYGRWLLFLFGATQHAGLDENVFDHRKNTRSVRMGRIARFLYLDMNFHLEHHLFPSVPYYRLEELSAEIARDLPEPSPSLYSALRDVRTRLASIREVERARSEGA